MRQKEKLYKLFGTSYTLEAAVQLLYILNITFLDPDVPRLLSV